MKTLDFLDIINGAIAERFKTLLKKPFHFTEVHGIVANTVGSMLKKHGLEYGTWEIRPTSERCGSSVIASDIKLFELTTEGFERYEGTKGKSWTAANGKWITPPKYRAVEVVKADTLEEMFKIAMFRNISERLGRQQEYAQECLDNHKKAVDYANELTEQRKQYA